jgi:hypothetical protein
MKNTHETKNKLKITFISRVPCPGYLVYEVEMENKDKKDSINYDLTKLRSRNGENIAAKSSRISGFDLLTSGSLKPEQTIKGYVALQPNFQATSRPGFYLEDEKFQIRISKIQKRKKRVK